jgi:hypothetical protein
MRFHETALRRLVAEEDPSAMSGDAVLSVLFRFRSNPQNPDNVPMSVDLLMQSVNEAEAPVLDVLTELVAEGLVEEPDRQGEQRALRMTLKGIRLVANLLRERSRD